MKPFDDPFLVEAIRSGLIALPTMPDKDPPPNIPVAPTEEILRDLDRDREER